MPVLNESEGLRQCLENLPIKSQAKHEIEVIICDGGSHDRTLEIARKFPVKIIHAAAGRANQMNAGAAAASGEIFLFLHADTTLPERGCDAVIKAIESEFSMGCFERKFTNSSRTLRKTSAWAGWRARKTYWVYGDQAMFMRRDVFEQISGFKPLARFEDLDLALRAKRHGRWTVLPGTAVSDARRFENGPLRRIIGDFLLTVGWLTGIIRK